MENGPPKEPPPAPVPTPPPAVAAQPPPPAPAVAPSKPMDLEGLRTWTAELDRKVGVRTYAGVAAVVLALATSLVAIVLAIDARDNSASNDDLNEIRSQISTIGAEAQAAQSAGADITTLDGRITSIEDQIATLDSSGGADTDKRLSAIETDIEDLRSQISALEPGTGSGGGGAGANARNPSK